MTRRVRHLGTIRHMAELRSPTLASLPTERVCEHAIARFTRNPLCRCTLTSARCGHVIAGQSTFFCDPVFRGYSPPLLAYCGGREVTGRFSCGKRRRAVDSLTGRWKLVSQCHKDPVAESSSLVRNRCGFVSHEWCHTRGAIAHFEASDTAIVIFEVPHSRATTSDRMLKQEYA